MSSASYKSIAIALFVPGVSCYYPEVLTGNQQGFKIATLVDIENHELKNKEGNMGGLKVLSVTELIVTHILLVGGLVLVTIGLLQGTMVLNVIGIWVLALGLCVGLGAALKKLATK